MLYQDRHFSAKAHWGEVIGVNADNYTADVKFTGGRIARSISWLSPYAFLNGNGMYIMPEIDSSVMLLEYAPNCLVILGFWPLRSLTSTSRATNRRKINLGDICIQGSDQCYILMRRGSEHIILQTSPKCSIVMKNSDNSINLDVQRLKIITDGSIMTWDSDPSTLNTTFTCMFKDKADEQLTTAFLTIGFHKIEDSEAAQAGIDKSIISLIVYETEVTEDNLATATPKFKLIVGSNGRIICSAESLMEIYRDFIDRYAESYMKDIAKKNITRESLDENISDKAKKIARTDAAFIHHNKNA